jgi:hypothetical protein
MEEKIILVALIPKNCPDCPLGSFPAFYGTKRFNTKFTRAHHLHLS